MPKTKLLFIIILGLGIIGGTALFISSLQSRDKTGILGLSSKKAGSFTIEGPNQIGVNTNFKIKFTASSNKQPINAVNMDLNYDPTKMSILTVDTSQSFCQFYPVNKFNNSTGKFTLACGAPSPGFTGENTIAVITFSAKNMGETSLTLTRETQLLLNDGQGTNIFTNPVSHQLVILNNI